MRACCRHQSARSAWLRAARERSRRSSYCQESVRRVTTPGAITFAPNLCCCCIWDRAFGAGSETRSGCTDVRGGGGVVRHRRDVRRIRRREQVVKLNHLRCVREWERHQIGWPLLWRSLPAPLFTSRPRSRYPSLTRVALDLAGSFHLCVHRLKADPDSARSTPRRNSAAHDPAVVRFSRPTSAGSHPDR